jgi:hypothetical protein
MLAAAPWGKKSRKHEKKKKKKREEKREEKEEGEGVKNKILFIVQLNFGVLIPLHFFMTSLSLPLFSSFFHSSRAILTSHCVAVKEVALGRAALIATLAGAP